MPPWRFGGRALLGLVVLLGTPALSGAAPPPDLGEVGAFRLTERGGGTVSNEDLLGKVWVASFQFTRCTGPCPQVSRTLARLQKELAGRRDLRLVTFTIDPEHDDPETLSRYAEAMGADPERWLFLTGPEADVHRLARDGFKLYVARRAGQGVSPGEALEHSPKLALVDRRGH